MAINRWIASALVVLSATANLPAQNASNNAPKDRPAAYYNYSMGHLYAELAAAYNNRGDYLSKAIDFYRLALKADPSASFLAEELSDLYIQSGKLRDAVTESEEALKQNPNDLTARRILGRIYSRLIGEPSQQRGRGINEEMLKRAIEQYDKITQADKDDSSSWLMLGKLQKLAQNSVDSEKAYKKVLELDADNEDAMTGLAMVYSDLGDSTRATEVLKKLTEKNPSLRTLTALASSYEQQREYGQAADVLKKALELQPGNDEVKRALAGNYLLADKLDEALKLFEEIVAEDPKDANSWLRISQIHRQKHNIAQAWDADKKARELEPQSLEIQYNEINLYEAEGKMTEAVDSLKKILASTAKRSYTANEKSNRALLLERLGFLYRQTDQTKLAVESFQQIAELDPEQAPRVSAQVVDTYRVARDFKTAIDEANAAVKKYPEDRTVRMVWASVMSDMGKPGEAAAEVKKLLDGKSDRETQLSLAQLYEKAKNYNEMAKAIDAAEKLSDSKEEKEVIYFTRGAMYEKMKNFDAAEKEFKKVLADNPNNASALNYLGYMLADRNVRLQEAVEMIKKAVDQEPNNGAYLDSLGWAYFRTGDYKSAEEALLRAVERTPKDPTIHDHLGDVYSKTNRLKEAIQQWQISLKEWENTSPSEQDPAEVAKIQKKLEGARVRQAKESGTSTTKQQ